MTSSNQKNEAKWKADRSDRTRVELVETGDWVQNKVHELTGICLNCLSYRSLIFVVEFGVLD